MPVKKILENFRNVLGAKTYGDCNRAFFFLLWNEQNETFYFFFHEKHKRHEICSFSCFSRLSWKKITPD